MRPKLASESQNRTQARRHRDRGCAGEPELGPRDSLSGSPDRSPESEARTTASRRVRPPRAHDYRGPRPLSGCLHCQVHGRDSESEPVRVGPPRPRPMGCQGRCLPAAELPPPRQLSAGCHGAAPPPECGHHHASGHGISPVERRASAATVPRCRALTGPLGQPGTGRRGGSTAWKRHDA